MYQELRRLSQLALSLRPFRTSIGYFGWTGFGNLGDEVLFEAIHELLKPFHVVKHAKFAGRGRRIQKWQEKNVLSAVLLGAGTLINSRAYLEQLRYFLREGLDAYVLGSGVLDPVFYRNDPDYPNCMKEWIEVLATCRYVAVRGPLSQLLLKEHGGPAYEMCGDPALFFADESITRKKGDLSIGINVGVTKNGMGLYGGSDLAFLDVMSDLCRVLSDKGYRLSAFPVSRLDLPICRELCVKLEGKVDLVDCGLSRENYMHHVRNVDMFIGEKLHSVILATCTYTPSIMLAYNPKCEDFMQSIQAESFCVRTDSLEVCAIVKMVEEIQSSLDDQQSRLWSSVGKLRGVLLECTEAMKEVLSQNIEIDGGRSARR